MILISKVALLTQIEITESANYIWQMAASDEELDRLEALREVIGRAVGFPSTVGGQDQVSQD